MLGGLYTHCNQSYLRVYIAVALVRSSSSFLHDSTYLPISRFPFAALSRPSSAGINSEIDEN